MPDPDLTAAEQARIDELFALVHQGTYYDLLGVAHDADGKTVQQAYYELSRAWHPDRYFRRELGSYRERLETVFATLTRAYKTLTNDSERLRYNRDLEGQGVKIGRSARRPAAPPPPPTPPPIPADTLDIPEYPEIPDAPPTPPPVTRPAPAQPAQPTPPPRPATPPTRPAPAPPPQPVAHEATLRRPTPASAGPAPGAPRPPSATPPSPGPATPPAAGRKPASPVLNAIREQVRERLEKARRFYQTGKEDFDAGRFVKAAGAFQLALELDPKNETYQRMHEEARARAQVQQAEHYVKLAQGAFENMQEGVGIAHLKKAIPYEPSDPNVYYRVGKWALEKENDQRTALQLFRKAVEKKPDSVEYRLALADLYAALKMGLNARREYQAVLDKDKKNERAKAGLAKVR